MNEFVKTNLTHHWMTSQGAAANMSVTQMKQFVANELRAMKTQSKAVALHISASEVQIYPLVIDIIFTF